jgi:hypothetical protein
MPARFNSKLVLLPLLMLGLLVLSAPAAADSVVNSGHPVIWWDDISNSVTELKFAAGSGSPLSGGQSDKSLKSGKDDKVSDNNGHGNNDDGVDSSNKGQGDGGPNGGVDASCDGSGPCIDDEGK